MDFIQLSKIAIEAAEDAGKIIQKYLNKHLDIQQKSGGTSYASQVFTEADKACESAILSKLLPTCKAYDLALLSEETEDDGSRFIKDFFWCIDPLDGTLSFIQKRPGFSVSIALVAKDGTPIIGVVYNPSTKNIYHAVRGFGAYKNMKAWNFEPKNKYLTYVSDRTLKETPYADKIEALLHEKAASSGLNGLHEISGSGSVLNGIHVLENGPACMLKLPKKEQGGGSIWDFAATACIFNELGLSATNYEGKRLDLNRKDGTFMNHEGVFFSNL